MAAYSFVGAYCFAAFFLSGVLFPALGVAGAVFKRKPPDASVARNDSKLAAAWDVACGAFGSKYACSLMPGPEIEAMRDCELNLSGAPEFGNWMEM